MALKTPRPLAEFTAGSILSPKISERTAAEGLAELVVDVTTIGQCAIFFDATDEATVTVDGTDDLLPERIERSGSQLIIEGRSEHITSINTNKRTRLVIEVHIPAATRLTVDFAAGQLILNGGTGDIDIDGKMGEIVGISHARRADVSMKCGAITLNELAGSADVHCAMGSVILGWSELIGVEQIDVDCGMGSIDLYFPSGVTPTLSRGGMGRETRLKTPSGASIHAKVGMGSLDIHDWTRRR